MSDTGPNDPHTLAPHGQAVLDAYATATDALTALAAAADSYYAVLSLRDGPGLAGPEDTTGGVVLVGRDSHGVPIRWPTAGGVAGTFSASVMADAVLTALGGAPDRQFRNLATIGRTSQGARLFPADMLAAALEQEATAP